MSGENTPAEQYSKSDSSKLWKKIKDAPFVPLGVLGALGMIGYGAYTYKEARARGLSTSVFMMQLRVKSQAMVVGALTLGIGYALLKDYVFYPEEHQKELDRQYHHNNNGDK